MPRHIPDNRVKALYHAIALGSVRAAADKLGVAPSSVSRQIVQLEADLAITLIERRRRGIAPTEAGKVLFEYYQERLAQTEAVEIRLDELQGLKRGHVSLAMGEGFVSDFFIKTLQRFRAQHPDITIDIGVHSTQRINELLINDEVQIGLIYNPDIDSNVQSAARQPQPLMALMSPEHPLAEVSGHIPMSAFTDIPVGFTRESYGIQMLLRRAETESGVRLNPVIRANSIAMIREFARANLGIAFLPKFAATRELEEGSLVARSVQSNVFQDAQAHIILRRGRRLSYAGERMLSFLSFTLTHLP